MNQVKLVSPTKEYEEQAMDYIQEFFLYNSQIHGVSGLNKCLDNYDEWLRKLDQLRSKEPDEIQVPAETFFLIREEDNRIIGMVNIRLRLNKALELCDGNIGYSIRPTERRKGYGTEILRLALKYCKKCGMEKVLLTCDKNNIGSKKVIQKNRGLFEQIFYDKESEGIVYKYWIWLTKENGEH